MAMIGLGSFAQNALGAYQTMHQMDAVDQELEIRRKKEAVEELYRQALIAEQQRKVQDLLDRRAAAGEVTTGMANVPEDQIPTRLREIYAKSKNPMAAMEAGETYIKGSGGILPATERQSTANRQQMQALINLHRQDPNRFPAQLIADQAMGLNIKPADLELIIPDIALRNDVMKAYLVKLNEVTGAAAGHITTPGAPTLPGQPRVGLPGQPGTSPIQNPATAGRINAAQAGAVETAQSEARVVGKGDALASTSPITGKTYGQGEANQAGLVAEAQETPLDKAIKNLKLQIDQAKLQMERAQLEMDPIKRANLASDVLQKLYMARYYANMVPQDDPNRKLYDETFENALKLMKTGSRPPLPQGGVPAPAPPVPPQQPANVPTGNTPATGRIPVRRKSDGMPGTIEPQDFNPNIYERR